MEPERIEPAPPEVIPTTPPEQTLREVLDEYIQNAEIFNEEEKAELRDTIADAINKVVDVPIIGEKIEGAAIRFLMGIAERTVLHYAKGLVKKITG